MKMEIKNIKKATFMVLVATAMLSFSACNKDSGTTEIAAEEVKATAATSVAKTDKDRILEASAAGKIGNWGLGNEYEILALLAKYDQPLEFLSQDFTMDGFDDDSIALASAMTYNELGLVKNDYDGAYGYGDEVGTIDMNDEGVAMLEDNLFTTAEFAKANPNTVKAFVYATLKGWEDATADPEAAAEVVYKYGSSVSSEHQLYMASEVKKLVETDTEGNPVSNYGYMDEEAMQQTLDLAKTYIKLDDSQAAAKLASLTLDDVRDTSYWEAATASEDGSDLGTPETTDVKVQLKWLPQSQFMGYYMALDKGYYSDLGLNVTIVPGGGDIAETTAVYNGTVDFGVTWVSNMISANAAGMGLLEVAQIYQRSGLLLVYKK
jgi:NitT/TauT family transport system substrate-binding protein